MRLPISRCLTAVATIATVALAGLVSAAAPQSAHAQAPIIDFTNGVAYSTSGTFSTYGYSFAVTGSQTITSLGFFDFGSDGLVNAHEVGLFDNSGILLSSTTISTALGMPVSATSSYGCYLARAIAPITLTSGTYVLGAAYGPSDADKIGYPSAVSTQAGFAYGEGRFVSGPAALTFPDSSAEPALIGPAAFTGAAAGASEPATIALALMAGLPGIAILGMQYAKPSSRRSAVIAA